MKFIKILLCVMLLCFACAETNTTNSPTPNSTPSNAIIPFPNKVNFSDKFSDIKEVNLPESGENYDIAFNAVNNYSFKNINININKNENVIISKLVTNETKGAFELNISNDKITIAANEKEGICNAMSRICQLSALNEGRLPICEHLNLSQIKSQKHGRTSFSTTLFWF